MAECEASDSGTPHHLSREWPAVSRASRLKDRLQESAKLPGGVRHTSNSAFGHGLESGREALDHADRRRGVPPRHVPADAASRRAHQQHRALVDAAPGRPLSRQGGAGTPSRRHPDVLPTIALRARGFGGATPPRKGVRGPRRGRTPLRPPGPARRTSEGGRCGG